MTHKWFYGHKKYVTQLPALDIHIMCPVFFFLTHLLIVHLLYLDLLDPHRHNCQEDQSSSQHFPSDIETLEAYLTSRC